MIHILIDEFVVGIIVLLSIHVFRFGSSGTGIGDFYYQRVKTLFASVAQQPTNVHAAAGNYPPCHCNV